ncbi:hypothetical protein NT01EI_0796 [Edwardsiella ictaluri 93-146]|uniref:Uncharacterized protein n=1 Tax=Edwardsiella ictaluri (strain 93-146) TaxID=634503 RepID=C5BH81_EDWI9|nr:hypothetical protein NT01EI_0796 [Edwardsiella ictaluri 93-146]
MSIGFVIIINLNYDSLFINLVFVGYCAFYSVILMVWF